jgi:hypothetical protein
MNWGEIELLDETPLAELELLARDRDLVDAQVVAAVARARDAGVGWGLIADALRGAVGAQPI